MLWRRRTTSVGGCVGDISSVERQETHLALHRASLAIDSASAVTGVSSFSSPCSRSCSCFCSSSRGSSFVSSSTCSVSSSLSLSLTPPLLLLVLLDGLPLSNLLLFYRGTVASESTSHDTTTTSKTRSRVGHQHSHCAQNLCSLFAAFARLYFFNRRINAIE